LQKIDVVNKVDRI